MNTKRISHLHRSNLFLISFVVGLLAWGDARALERTQSHLFARDANPELAEGKPMIQIALLLDTSNSMDGLIRQAKTKLWAIVNEFAQATREGEDPIFQIGLYEFGRNTLPVESGHVRKVSSLTSDLDEVFESLFSLQATTVSGSNEYCGWVLDQAVKEHGWSQSNDDLKTICIAGNETFKLGPVDYLRACKAAVEQGITVNTIFCGNRSQGIGLGWKEGSDRADGAFMAIDQNQMVAQIAAPQDVRLRELNEALNSTYLPYGALGIQGRRRLAEQDAAAEELAVDAFFARTATKSGKYYDAAQWDLVDAVQQDRLQLESLEKSELPPSLQKLSVAEQKRQIGELSLERRKIQEQIQSLSLERSQYLEEQRKSADPESTANNLEHAVVESLKQQAIRKNFQNQ